MVTRLKYKLIRIQPPHSMKAYFQKMKGGGTSPPATPLANIFWSFIGAFLGISSLHHALFSQLATTDVNMVIGSFGASAVLVYGAIDSPLAQPRNLVGGHILSAIVGVFCYQWFAPLGLWFTASLAVAGAIALMHITKTLHPPGGATALIDPDVFIAKIVPAGRLRLACRRCLCK